MLDNILKLEATPAWHRDCILNDTGKPIANLANALIALRAIMPGTFAFNEMARASMLMEPLDGANDFTVRPITDADVTVVHERLQHLGLKRITRDTVHQAVDGCAHEKRFHPVRDYLDGLVWDETPRTAKLFTDYFGTEAPPYTQAIGSMFLISMVAAEL
jgi:predicted P-loop ATPase